MRQIQVFRQNRQATETNGFSKGAAPAACWSVLHSFSHPLISLFHRNVAHDLVLANEKREGVDWGILGSCNCFATSSQSEPEKGISF